MFLYYLAEAKTKIIIFWFYFFHILLFSNLIASITFLTLKDYSIKLSTPCSFTIHRYLNKLCWMYLLFQIYLNVSFLVTQLLFFDYKDVTDLLHPSVIHGMFSYFGPISVFFYGQIRTFFTVLPPIIWQENHY